MKKTPTEITVGEWIAELARLGHIRETSDGMTVQEISAATGLSTQSVHRKLRLAKAAGRLIVARKKSALLWPNRKKKKHKT